jgi:hypothetical protein
MGKLPVLDLRPLPKPKRVNVGPRMFVGMLSGRVYWAPRVTAEPHEDGTATFRVVGDKRDVTDMFEKCALELGWKPPKKKQEKK